MPISLLKIVVTVQHTALHLYHWLEAECCVLPAFIAFLAFSRRPFDGLHCKGFPMWVFTTVRDDSVHSRFKELLLRVLLPLPLKVDRGCFHLCLSVSRISQKVMDRFGQTLVDRLGVWLGRIDSISVKIRIWIQGFFNFGYDSSPLSDGAKTFIARCLKKLLTDLDETWWMSWLGDENKPTKF